ncbi:MAG TPA: GNAT family N-acetyltransferase [Methylomirabilota bacterium]|nr:GNAT family N-acetyltransferase [Methylomirabilota bacterium]
MSHGGTIAETDRLIIRLLSEADVRAIAGMWCDEKVTRFMGGPRSFDKVVASLKDDLAPVIPRSFELWPVEEKDTRQVIGQCGLLRKQIGDHTEVELIYVLASDYWGRGYATEAASAVRDHGLQRLGCKRLVSLIAPQNAASERVARKVGMTFEADTIRPNGKRMRLYAIST